MVPSKIIFCVIGEEKERGKKKLRRMTLGIVICSPPARCWKNRLLGGNWGADGGVRGWLLAGFCSPRWAKRIWESRLRSAPVFPSRAAPMVLMD